MNTVCFGRGPASLQHGLLMKLLDTLQARREALDVNRPRRYHSATVPIEADSSREDASAAQAAAAAALTS